MSTDQDKAIRCFTFYSYKGGVGRSMALANVAVDLATRNGKRVLAIDWDLDAPGLHYYFGIEDWELREQPGLVDFLEDGSAILNGQEVASNLELMDYVRPGVFVAGDGKSSVDLMIAGRRDDGFIRRVGEMDWDRFYEEGGGFAILESLRLQALDTYDIVLVDSRSGASDASVMASHHMPEMVIMLFAANGQSIEGTADLARRLSATEPRASWDRTPLRFLFVPSRVFMTSARFSEWMDGPAKLVSTKLETLGLLERTLQPHGLWQFLLNVEPEAAVGETILSQLPNGTELTLHAGYSSLSNLLSQLSRGGIDWQSDPFVPYTTLRSQIDDLRQELQESIRRGDDATSHLLRLSLSKLILRTDKASDYSQVSAMLPASFTYFQNKGDARNAAISCMLLGRAEYNLNNASLALEYVHEGLRIVLSIGEPIGEAVLRHDLGNVLRRYAQSDETQYDEAIEEYSKSVTIKLELKEFSGAARTIHQLGSLEMDRKNHGAAEGYFQQALMYARESNDLRGEAIEYHALGNLYAERQDNVQALRYFEEALKRQDPRNNPQGQAITLRRMGDCYRYMAPRGESRHPLLLKAIECYQNSLELALPLDDMFNVQLLYTRMGETARLQEDNESASVYFQQALGVGRVDHRSGGLADVFTRLAEVEIENGSLRQAGGLLRAAERELSSAQQSGIARRIRERFIKVRDRYDQFMSEDLRRDR